MASKPGTPLTKAGRALVQVLRDNGGSLPPDAMLVVRILAIEREAQGIPPSEALRLLRRLVAVVDAAGMLWTDPVPADSMAAIHDAKEFLAATPSGGIPLIDVERPFKAGAERVLVELTTRPIAYIQHPKDGVSEEWIAVGDIFKVVEEVARLASESSPAEEGAE